jgi:hypothetical protein
LTFLSIDGGRSQIFNSGKKIRVLALLKGSYRFKLPSKKFKITEQSAEELAPPAGSQPLPRWAW